VAQRLVVDAARERVEAWRPALEAAGYRIDDGEPDLIVLGIPGGASPLTDALASGVPLLGVVAPESWEEGMRAAIEGAVRCVAEPIAPETMVVAVNAVLGADAPPIAEQRRRARQRALTLLARREARGAASYDDDEPRSVHLTRLEHRTGSDAPAPASDALADARRRLTALTTKQRGLLHVVEAEGSVSAAATRLGTSRGNVYAGLRRIVHRLGVRDTAELLRLVGSGELLRAARP
jgi:DNA-binding NarL/FixJ family response regulator